MTANEILALCNDLPTSRVTDYLSWIPLLPFIGFLINGVLGRWLHRSANALLACATVGFAFLLAVWGLLALNGLPEWLSSDMVGLKTVTDTCVANGMGADLLPVYKQHVFDWIPLGSGAISLTLRLDPLSSLMMLIVTGVGFLIHVYSAGYMEHDKAPARYFAYLNLFMAAMLLLVMADSLPVMFVGWEGVGLCSYLLIGFWYEEDANASAGKKAFIMNRIGDLGFLLGIFVLFTATGALDFDGIAAGTGALEGDLWEGIPIAFVAGTLLFVGATGKSAQIPLYTWLPDAMAGPTPVSALIHAATMVTAGVYMVARMNFVYALSPGAMLIVTCIGVATALLAGLIAVFQYDIKKVLAYSTVSQLGFMFAAVGSGAYWVGIFHVMTHAFFKACLFLGSGSVIHACDGEQDMRRMGGLGRWMPTTRTTFFIATIAIAGVPFLSGFFSKDLILWGVYSHALPWASVAGWLPQLLWFLLIVGAVLTAFYMTRLYTRVFSGPFRGAAKVENHLHESPPLMTWPLILLAAGAIAAGYVGLGDIFLDTFAGTHHGVHASADGIIDYNALRFFLAPVVEPAAGLIRSRFEGVEPGALHMEEWILVFISILAALGGIWMARERYTDGRDPGWGPLEGFAASGARAFRVDDLYDWLVVRRVRQLADLLHVVVDEGIIDTIFVRGAAALFQATGWALRRLQNGKVQFYAFLMILSIAALMAFMVW